MESSNNKQRTIIACIVVVCFVLLTVGASMIIISTLGEDQLSMEESLQAAIPTTEQTQPPTQATEETTQATTQPEETTQATTLPVETTQETTVETTAETTAETTEATQPATEQTEPETQQTQPTQAPTQQTQPVGQTPTVPPAMEILLARGGVSAQTLAEKGCNQLVTVSATGTNATIQYFVCDDGAWEELTSLSNSGQVGRGGVTSNKREGDGCTPTGLYSIGSAFYIYNAPNTGLDTFEITKNTYWVDDPNSRYYNQRVEGTANKDWSSAEHMIDYREYNYGFVVNYNTDCVYNAGSAIFFHIGSSTTAGCIATNQQVVLAYLAQLDKTQNPHILIVSG